MVRVTNDNSTLLGDGTLYWLSNTGFQLTEYPFQKQQILDSPKLKDFADDNLKFSENARKFSRWVENTVGKGEIAHYEQFLLFPTVFSKDLYCRHVKTRACVGKGYPCNNTYDIFYFIYTDIFRKKKTKKIYHGYF